MPFNKGDFTQQGVAGHVNANLRLNEKRLVNIDMTSNEEAEGCTIAGTVTDLLNDKVYNIGSAPSGNIEITENGENINVAPYATASVNVAGGGGTELLKTTITYDGTALAVDSMPVFTAIGYGYIAKELNNTDPAFIYAYYNDNDSQFVLTAGSGEMIELTVHPGEILSVNLYYIVAIGESPTIGILSSQSNTTATNMTYNSDAGAWIVTDTSIDSSMTVNLGA